MSDGGLFQAIERYLKCHEEHPGEARGLGWGSERAQWKRFVAACEAVKLEGLSVLDAGSGYGDLLPFALGAGASSYLGVDVVDRYVAFASEKWGHLDGNWAFKQQSVLDVAEEMPESSFDVVFALGTAAFEHEAYFDRVMRASYRLARIVAVVSVTTVSTPGPTDGVVLLHPADFASKAFGLTPCFVLRHDYLPSDEMVYLYKNREWL